MNTTHTTETDASGADNIFTARNIFIPSEAFDTAEGSDAGPPVVAAPEQLLAAERRIAVEWLSMLGELMLRGELPSWAADRLHERGNAPEEWRIARARTDQAILGEPVPPRFRTWAAIGRWTEPPNGYCLGDGNGLIKIRGLPSLILSTPGIADQLTVEQLGFFAVGLRIEAQWLRKEGAGVAAWTAESDSETDGDAA